MSKTTHERTNTNVTEFLLAGKDTSAIALMLPQVSRTYGELRSAADQVAAFLLGAGCRKGDRVLLVSDNSFFWVAAYLGILRASLVCVPLPSKASAADLAYICNTTSARAAFLGTDVYSKNKDLFASLQVVTATDCPDAGARVLSLDELLAKGAPEPGIFEPTHPNNIAALMFTSGSTAEPRGVMVTHANIIANTESIISYLHLTSLDRAMAVLPFHYCFGTSLLHTHLRVGGSLVIENRFMYPEVVLERMRQTECTGFAGVPSHYQILLRRSSFTRSRIPSLRLLQQAGGHLAPTFIRQIREAMPQVEFYVMYGQTEATARLAYMPPDMIDRKLGSIGKAIPGVLLRVLDEEGFDVNVGEIGEIVAEGGNIAVGYWMDEAATAASFRNGKLYTGDMATVDEDGYIYVVDRAQDFIKCGGRRVSCHQIQDSLLEFEEVLEVAVVGIPDPILGEAVCAFVVPRQANDPTFEQRFSAYCRERLSFQLAPRTTVVMKDLPKSTGGKVVKHVLKEIASTRQACATPRVVQIAAQA